MADSFGEGWLKDEFGRKWEDTARMFGRFNLGLFGKTGVGKSTLVNAIFGETIARTGIGEPVTTEEHLYLHDGGFLGVLDTRGVEVGTDNEAILAELSQYVRRMRAKPLADQLHAVWYCVRAGDRRFEDTEADFIRRLDELGLPVILVLTQVAKVGDRYHPDAQELARAIEDRQLPIAGGRVFLTMALADEFSGHEAHGLIEVLDETFKVAPDGVENAIAAAQQIDQRRKRAVAKRVIEKAAGAAAAAGATPIPFADAVVLVPIQLGMMASIARTFNVGFERATVASLAATAAATTTGKSLAANTLKLIPGVGTVVGGSINATVAGTLTYAMGQAWLQVCVLITEGKLERFDGAVDADTVRKVFTEEFVRQFKKRSKEIDSRTTS